MTRSLSVTPEAGELAFYTDAQAAEILQVPERWLAAKARRGEIPHCAFGRQRRYSRDHIHEIGLMFARGTSATGLAETAPPAMPARRRKTA